MEFQPEIPMSLVAIKVLSQRLLGMQAILPNHPAFALRAKISWLFNVTESCITFLELQYYGNYLDTS